MRLMELGKRQAEAVFEVSVWDKQDSSRSHNEMEDSQVEQVMNKVLTLDLPDELEQRFGLKVKVEMRGNPRYGSITMFFAAAITGYVLISRYKSFNESIGLIAKQAHDLLDLALRRFGRYSVSVDAVYPRYIRPEEFDFGRKHSPFLPWTEAFDEPTVVRHRRDSFFWFLLVACVLESAALAALIYGAVSQVYFGG